MNTEDRIQNVSFRSLSVHSIAKNIRNPQSAIRNGRRLSIVCLLVLVACGYQMVGKETHVPPGLNSVAIPTFHNLTFEPGIEVQFTRGFLKEFIQDRRVNVVGRSEADSILEGVIKSFAIYSVSYDRSGLVLEYQTNVVLDLTLKKKTGEILWTEKNIAEARWFRASSNVLASESNKTAAIEQLGAFVAERIRSRFFYNF
jgi:outer membrane lipopolysaccharide assembly protein LptE/RlpB